MSTNTNKKTVSITTATHRTAADAWDRARNNRLKKAKDTAKKGIDIREDGVVYLDDSMSPGERAAAVKSAMAAATFAIGDSKVINVLTGALALPKSYQRDPNEGTKRLLRTNFSMKKLNPLLVSYRDGVLLVLDGGHRLEIAIELGIPFLPVKVLEGLTIEEEATLFATQDDQKVTVKAAQKFKAGLVAKDQIASTIYAICDSYGLTVTNKPSGVDRPMKAITAAVDVVKNSAIDGPDCLSWMLGIMDDARWFEDRGMLLNALSSRFLYGFMAVYTEGMRENTLTQYTRQLRKELRKLSPSLITSYGELLNPSMDPRGYTKRVLRDIACGIATAKDVFGLAMEENNKTQTA